MRSAEGEMLTSCIGYEDQWDEEMMGSHSLSGPS